VRWPRLRCPANGTDDIVLVRTPEEDARNVSLAVTGRAIIVMR
jgi:hypothetical protein